MIILKNKINVDEYQDYEEVLENVKYHLEVYINKNKDTTYKIIETGNKSLIRVNILALKEHVN